MKFLFTGCSYTWGDELKNREEERWSSYFKGDNVARCGWSNDSIVRSVIENEKGYDKVVVQLTKIQRMYHPKKDYVPSDDRCRKFYEEFYEREIGIENFWKNVWVLRRLLGDRLVLLSIKRPASCIWTEECEMIIIRDLIGVPAYSRRERIWRSPNKFYEVNGHPTAEAHRIIANEILKMI
jgi:hypothetical protein